MFGHTYCAARLQTLDGAAPVSPYTVRREMGHGSQAMVDKVYSHLGAARHRSPVVEYRVGQHVSILRDRLTALQAGAALRALGRGYGAEPYPGRCRRPEGLAVAQSAKWWKWLAAGQVQHPGACSSGG